MGFFSKLWKGIKKPFKAIGKAVKSAFKSFGKFMNKAGILGQVAMFFILPGIANAAFGALGSMWTGVAGKLAGVASKGVMGSIARGAGWVMQKAGQFAGTVTAGFKTVTGAVTEFFGATGRYIGGKLGITPKLGGMIQPKTLGEAWGQYSEKMVSNFDAFVGKGSEFLGTSSVAATAGAVPLPSTAPVVGDAPSTFETGFDVDATGKTIPGSVRFGTDPMTNFDPKRLGRLSSKGLGIDFGMAPETPSLLSKVKAMPGEFKEYVMGGGLKDDAFAKAKALPGAVVSNMAMSKVMEAIDPAEEYEAKTPWGSNAGTYRSSQAIQASQVDDYTSFASQYTIGTSPDGMWGGAVNTKNYYDNYMQQFAA
jgi:hypothetical protein